MLPISSRLGPYEIVSSLGAGGMGEVYRAHDSRLGRDVAIKVLPSAFSADPERLQRFEQEARSAAALNHPNILAVHDIGQHDGSPYIVSELLEGKTLRERLNAGAIPVRRAVEYAIQIAHGLAAAHEKGIAHRDLKPENVFVTNDGRVKILDFGLAKLTQAEPALMGLSALPTTPPNTTPGVVLGTIGYMSPEQVRGLPADHRSDIFAFGAVLYELLSGHRAFHGETPADTMSAILKQDPADIPAGERQIPPALARIVDRCLEKNPFARFKSADDLGFALDTLSTHSSGATTSGKLSPPSVRPWRSAARMTGLLILGAGLAITVSQFVHSPELSPVVRFQIPPPAGGLFPGANNTPRFSISPDGQYIVFTVNTQDGKPEQLWVRRLDSVDARALASTEASQNAVEPVQQPFWSPDSRHVGFFADDRLKKLDVDTGAIQTVANVPGNNWGGTWNRDGTILLGTASTKGIQSVSADGGVVSQVTTIDETAKETSHLWPQFLPDGRHFLYLALVESSLEDRGVYVGSLGSNERKLLFKSTVMAQFAPPGYLLFVRDNALMAQRFDSDALELQGEPVQLVDGVQAAINNGRAGFGVSDTGVLAYRPRSAGTLADSELVWFDRAGKQLSTVAAAYSYRGIELSPDDQRVAVHREERDGAGDMWMLDLQRGSTARLTFDATQHNMSPVWSRDGRKIFFSKNVAQTWAIYETDSSGVGGERLLHEAKGFGGNVIPLDVTPDGQQLIFRDLVAQPGNQPNQGDISVLSLSGEPRISPYLQNPFNQVLGQVSPDGRWIAYRSNESGRDEIYVQSFPMPGTRFQVSTAGGTHPRWRRDGKELFYIAYTASPSGTLTSVSIETTSAGLRFGIPERLFDSYAVPMAPHPLAFSYSVSSDGKRFLVARQLAAAANSNPAETPLTVVLNWTATLEK